ncbi:MAG TPA: YhbY family RNA-binding protein [Candidatus Bathyarchaeota archaeon]|nr:YhbY family RNA-binding protein [Candidatus Bathyarchaeota archaeon]
MTEKISSKLKRKIKREVVHEKPTVWIGKSGTSPSIIEEIKKQLKAQGKVKVRVLKAALHEHTVKEIASKIVEETGSSLIEIRGHTFILHKPKR